MCQHIEENDIKDNFNDEFVEETKRARVSSVAVLVQKVRDIPINYMEENDRD